MTNSHTLQGMATVSYFADDMIAARKWYTELLGIEPYFERPNPENPAYVEFRIGDYQHELGIVDRRYAPKDAASTPGGAILHWHVDDIEGTLERLKAMGAKEYTPLTPRESGFITASVVDPFGNLLGIMYNPHYLKILSEVKKA